MHWIFIYEVVLLTGREVEVSSALVTGRKVCSVRLPEGVDTTARSSITSMLPVGVVTVLQIRSI